jgi:hypothetical protein
MDTKIETVISSISDTVTKAIKTQMESMETHIAQMVADAIMKQSGSLVTQVAASITGAHSPFVTGEKLQNILDNFIGKINTRIDHLSDSYYMDPNGSPVRKQFKTALNAHDMSMDTQPSNITPITNPYATTTEAVAGENN